jgi:hypothetical protein
LPLFHGQAASVLREGKRRRLLYRHIFHFRKVIVVILDIARRVVVHVNLLYADVSGMPIRVVDAERAFQVHNIRDKHRGTVLLCHIQPVFRETVRNRIFPRGCSAG